jgi:hypothetical protein
MMYEEWINGQLVYFSEGLWFVRDEYGDTPYETFADAKAAAEEV